MDAARVLEENGITPKKELDQFFLNDERVLEKEIALAKLSPSDTVLEIGAGIGNLTSKIAEKCRVVAIEKDFAFKNLLKNIPNSNVIFGDALEVLESLRKIREKDKGKPQFNKIVSNIPYSITQDILVEVLQHEWKTAVLAVQKEFSQKLKQKEKIAVVVNDCCNAKVAADISAVAFYPKAADSSIIVLEQKHLLDAGFWEFLKAVFKNKNKDVKNVCKDYPVRLAKKKIHQLTIEELKQLYEMRERLEGDT